MAQKYITIMDRNSSVSNVGTIGSHWLEGGFKQAITEHYGAELIRVDYPDGVTGLDDAFKHPIEIEVTLFEQGDNYTVTLELSQTWFY